MSAKCYQTKEKDKPDKDKPKKKERKQRKQRCEVVRGREEPDLDLIISIFTWKYKFV